jgi:hypothetical protein
VGSIYAGPVWDGSSAIFLNAEDDLNTTVVARLRAAGANLEKVHIMPTLESVGSSNYQNKILLRNLTQAPV